MLKEKSDLWVINSMKIGVDRLILEDLDLSPSQRALLQTTFESELSRLLAVQGVPQHLEHGGKIPKLLTSLNVADNMNPRQMGQGIAQSIFKAMQSSAGHSSDKLSQTK